MEDSETGHYVELWKQTIAVQQHFNDICWRIRGLALTAMTFALGAAAVAVQEKVVIRIFGLAIELGAVVLVLGTLLWCAFFFVDRAWYHQLLKGAVGHGQELENELRKKLPVAGLTLQISKSSPTRFGQWKWREKRGGRPVVLHSTGKLLIFYWFGIAVLLILGAAVQAGA